MARKYVLVMAVLLLLPGVARADWLFTPYGGMTFGQDAKSLEHFNWGGTAGWMGHGIVGFEVDFNHTPNFFEPKDNNTTNTNLFGKNNVTSLMGNVLVGVPVGGQRGGGIRPYASAGVGLLKQNVPGSGDFLDVSRNDWGFNIGVGAHVFASDHVGFRGDVRYVRSLQNDEGTPDDFKVGNFDFWRWTVGVTFR